MERMFQDKVVLLLGATGGLGSAAAQAFSEQGARLILAGRDLEKLKNLGRQTSSLIFQVDIANPESVDAVRDNLRSNFAPPDIVVNLTGADVRKPLESHTTEDIQRMLAVNLAGSIYLTRAFLPLMKSQLGSVILHVGGFADGRMAFPFYSVDVATRAGLSAFIESVNRELRLEKSPLRVVYFSPSPADTEAERPFHAIWREMGLQIEPTSRVVNELLQAVSGQHERYLMGGILTDLFARINAAFPGLANTILMNRYGAILQKHLGE